MEREVELFVDSLREQLSAEDIASLEACVGCKNCGQACAWWLATGKEELHPAFRLEFVRDIYKRYLTLEGRAKAALGLVHSPGKEELKRNMEYYWQCTACGRCTLACPFGISVRRVVRLARMAYSSSGLAEENPTLKSIVENTRELRHSFGLTREQVFSMVGLFLLSEDIEIPVDVEGAEYLFICPAFCNTKVPDYGIKLPMILNTAKVSYSISSRVIDTGTDIDPIASHPELSRQMLLDWEREAERLNAEKILLVECGCDVRTLYVEATETLGREFKFPIVSVDTLMLELIRAGELPVEKLKRRVTLHDPCYVTRLSGMGDELRELVQSVAEDFVEMQPNRELNYCCNAGGGPLRLPENAGLRREVSSIKAEQIRSTGAELVASPCAVCAVGIQDLCSFYGLTEGKRISLMLFELVYEAIRRALEKDKRGEERMRTPVELEGRDEGFLARHSLSGMMAKLKESSEFPELLSWLENHSIVERHAKQNPKVWAKLRELRGEEE